MDSNALLDVCHSIGLAGVRNHMSALSPEAAERLRRHVQRQREEQVRRSVIRRRARPAAPKAAPEASVAEPEPPPAARPEAAPAGPKAAPEAVRPAAAAEEKKTEATPPARRPDGKAPAERQRPKTGVEVWEGRPGVPKWEPPKPRTPHPARRPGPAREAGRPAGARRTQYAAEALRGRGRPGAVRKRERGRRRGPAAAVTQERAPHKKVIRIEGGIALQSLAAQMGVKAIDLLRKLLDLGATGAHINSTLDPDTAKLVANELGWDVEDVAMSEAAALQAARGAVEAEVPPEGLEPRPPIVTVMGHVDHGKTSLLDRVRKTSVAAQEAGGITQHIGAYEVATPRGRITFLDTPGHEAFTAMRARGAQVTDVVILVVAADDGVMPQTREAVDHARAAGVPIVVAVNKIDKPDAHPERVRRELAELGLVPEEWGGDTLFAEVSAVTGQGIDDLLMQVQLQAELLERKATRKMPASGVVVEARLDRGKGPVATVLVTGGTLRRGDALIAGGAWGKVRAMEDDAGRPCLAAGPARPVSVTGLDEVPSAGDAVHAVADLRKAQEIVEQRRSRERERAMSRTARFSLEDLQLALHAAEEKELKIVVKADAQGSVEALRSALAGLASDEVRVTVLHAAVGAVTETDVNLAAAARAVLIGFNVRPAGKASALAERLGVDVRLYRVIYEAIDDVKLAMLGLLAPKVVEKVLGHAEVRKLFKVPKVGVVAGCRVLDGSVSRGARARLLREGNVLWEGGLASLRQFAEDVREVKAGQECGIALKGDAAIEEGDIIESFELEEQRRKQT